MKDKNGMTDKEARARQKTIEAWKAFSPQTCRTKTARIFQRMTKAEAAAEPAGFSPHVLDGVMLASYRHIGQVVCITCGKVSGWDVKAMHCGHWIGRAHASTLLESDNVACQCALCNNHNHGRLREFTLWMESVRGINTIERLQSLKRQSVAWSREDLVDKRIAFAKRLKAAELSMICQTQGRR